MPNLTLPPLDDRPLTRIERAGVLERVDELLHVTYRERDLGNFQDPLQELVYILLSAQTREVVYQRVSAELFARWPTWHDLLAAPLDEVRAVINPAGFPYRATHLQELLATVAGECERRGFPGQITLDWLHEMSDAAALAFLKSLPGVGEKSARCVMHYSLDRATFAVDTHARRILHRLDLVPDAGGKVRHGDYDAVIPPKMRQRLHVNLVHHGRAVCTTQAPKCGDCPLISFCPKGRSATASIQDDRPTVVEVFAGGGGMGAGFAAAGYRITLAIEMDRHAAQTYRANHPGTVVLEADAMRVSRGTIKRLAPGALSPTVVAAGPPCQGYSAAGARDPGDIKNVLYREVIRLARSLRPRFVVIENVPGMRKVGGVSFVRAVLAELDDAGYEAEEYLLRACDFGVPQLRHRILYLAQRRALGGAPSAPAPTHCPGEYCSEGCGRLPGSRCNRPYTTPSVAEALATLPVLAHGTFAECEIVDGRLMLNGSTMNHSRQVIDKIRGIKAGKGPISYRRLHGDLARTIVAGHRALPVHPFENRTISVREAARIQGFDDAHVFCGPRGAQPLQVANAVPPALAQAVAGTLLAILDPVSARRARKASTTPASRPSPTAAADVATVPRTRSADLLALEAPA